MAVVLIAPLIASIFWTGSIWALYALLDTGDVAAAVLTGACAVAVVAIPVVRLTALGSTQAKAILGGIFSLVLAIGLGLVWLALTYAMACNASGCS